MRDVKNRDFHQASHIQSSVLLVLNKYNQYSRESAVGVSRVTYEYVNLVMLTQLWQ